MAIVLSAPNPAKKVLLWVFYPTLFLVVAVIAVAVFFPQLQNILEGTLVITPNTNPSMIVINIDFLDSQELQQLQPFTQNQ